MSTPAPLANVMLDACRSSGGRPTKWFAGSCSPLDASQVAPMTRITTPAAATIELVSQGFMRPGVYKASSRNHIPSASFPFGDRFEDSDCPDLRQRRARHGPQDGHLARRA